MTELYNRAHHHRRSLRCWPEKRARVHLEIDFTSGANLFDFFDAGMPIRAVRDGELVFVARPCDNGKLRGFALVYPDVEPDLIETKPRAA